MRRPYLFGVLLMLMVVATLSAAVGLSVGLPALLRLSDDRRADVGSVRPVDRNNAAAPDQGKDTPPDSGTPKSDAPTAPPAPPGQEPPSSKAPAPESAGQDQPGTNKQQLPVPAREGFDELADLHGKTIVVSGWVSLITQDMDSFLEGMTGHSIPVQPVVVLHWWHGKEVECWFDAEDDRLPSLGSAAEVRIKGVFDFTADTLVIVRHCVLLPEDATHVHPFDKEKAVAEDAAWARSWKAMMDDYEQKTRRKPSHEPMFQHPPFSP